MFYTAGDLWRPSPVRPTFHKALVMVAQLGGYIGKGKGKPQATTTTWHRLIPLEWITDALVDIRRDSPGPF